MNKLEELKKSLIVIHTIKTALNAYNGSNATKENMQAIMRILESTINFDYNDSRVEPKKLIVKCEYGLITIAAYNNKINVEFTNEFELYISAIQKQLEQEFLAQNDILEKFFTVETDTPESLYINLDEIDHSKCVICGGRVITRCRCPKSDATCENGHQFHWSPNVRQYHEGHSYHGTPFGGGMNLCCSSSKIIVPVKEAYKEKEKPKVNNEGCMICGDKIVRVCKCPRKDTTCINGHEYHFSVPSGEFHIGPAYHRGNPFGADCCKDKKTIGEYKNEPMGDENTR